jgi:tetratricopeptide (TPR) repeat protein
MPADVENRIAGFRAAPGFSAKALLANVLAHQGKNDEVKEILEWSVVNRPDVGTDEDMMPIWIDALYLESAVLAGHQRSAELLMNRFKGTGIYTSGSNSPKCVLRHMGEAAVLLGKHGEAREYYKEAIRVCTEMRFRPELALSRLDLAELLLDHYPDEKKQALEHLDFAIKEFREMKMQPSLERALRRKEILKA